MRLEGDDESQDHFDPWFDQLLRDIHEVLLAFERRVTIRVGGLAVVGLGATVGLVKFLIG